MCFSTWPNDSTGKVERKKLYSTFRLIHPSLVFIAGSKLGNVPEDGKTEGNHLLAVVAKDYFKVTRRPELGYVFYNSIEPRVPALSVHEARNI